MTIPETEQAKLQRDLAKLQIDMVEMAEMVDHSEMVLAFRPWSLLARLGRMMGRLVIWAGRYREEEIRVALRKTYWSR